MSDVSEATGLQTADKVGPVYNQISRARTVQVVLEFAEAPQRFWSRVPQEQPNIGNGS